jgi:hypothetical protein
VGSDPGKNSGWRVFFDKNLSRKMVPGTMSDGKRQKK